MNKIYRTLWNVATQSWVVVSELGATKGKTKATSLGKVALTTTALVVGVSTSDTVLGQEIHFYSVETGQKQAGSNYDNKGATGEDSLAAGIQTNATARQAIAIGSEVTASGDQSLAIGNNVVASMLGATSIGNNSRATAVGAQAFGQSSEATAILLQLVA